MFDHTHMYLYAHTHMHIYICLFACYVFHDMTHASLFFITIFSPNSYQWYWYEYFDLNMCKKFIVKSCKLCIVSEHMLASWVLNVFFMYAVIECKHIVTFLFFLLFQRCFVDGPYIVLFSQLCCVVQDLCSFVVVAVMAALACLVNWLDGG